MKKRIWKQALCMIFSIIMMISVVPVTTVVKHHNVKAATGDETIQKNKANVSEWNAIDQVIFKERSDGRYDVYVHIDPSVYNKSYYKPIAQWRVYDHDHESVLTGWSDETVRKNNYRLKVSTVYWESSSVEAGKEIRLSAVPVDSTGKFITGDLLVIKSACGYFTAPKKETPRVDPIVSRNSLDPYIEGVPVYGEKFYFTPSKIVKVSDELSTQFAKDSSMIVFAWEDKNASESWDDTKNYQDYIESGDLSMKENAFAIDAGEIAKYNIGKDYRLYIKNKVTGNEWYSKTYRIRKDIYDIQDITLRSAYYNKLKINVRWYDQYKTSATAPDGINIYRNGKLIKSVKYQDIKTTCWDSGLKANTSYTYNFVPYYQFDSHKFEKTGYAAKAKFKTAAFTSGSLKAVNINSNYVKIVLNVPGGQRYKGACKFNVYAGSKKIKTVSATTADQIRFSYKKSKAASQKYKVQATASGYSKTSKSVKTESNVATYSPSTNPKNYKYATARFLPTKIYYSGNKLKVTGYLLNSRILDLKSAKIKIKITTEGKTIGSQTFSYKSKIGSYGKKKITFTFSKGKKDYNLRYGGIRYSTSVTPKW